MAELWRYVVVLAFSFLISMPVHASSTYETFSSVIDVNPDASFTVTETITGNFAFERHGIYRAIPVRYDAGHGTVQTIPIEVTGVTRDGNPEPYDVYREGDYLMVKVGDADVTFEGPFTYVVSYQVQRAILYGETSDELYWNVTGNNWDESFSEVNATIRVSGVTDSDFKTACYTGAYGSTERKCRTKKEDGLVTVTAQDFLTVSVSFPKGVVTEPSNMTRYGWWLQDNWQVFLLFIPLVTIFWAVRHWFKYGRDPKGRGTIIAEYEPPAGFTPTEAGTLTDAVLHDKDFSAGIVDLAVRGYLQIAEDGKKDYVLTRKRTDTDGLKPFERELLEKLFGSEETVKTKTIDGKERFVKARKEVAKLVYESMATDGYFVKNPSTVRGKYLIGGSVLVCLVFFAFTPWVAAAALPTAIAFIVLAVVMPRRTDKGTQALDQLRGFKEYLSCAEKYRIQWQEKENIFETFLPYAMAFGVASKWTKALATQETSQPTWYVGNIAAFSAADFGDRMSTLGSSLGAVSAPRSSGGGGGMSGGGFGGGGGGSW